MTTYVQLAHQPLALLTYRCQRERMMCLLLLLTLFQVIRRHSMHVAVGLFEVMDISGITMAPKLNKLLDRFSLTQKTLAFVQDERSNL
jgi:hypothetical protein